MKPFTTYLGVANLDRLIVVTHNKYTKKPTHLQRQYDEWYLMNGAFQQLVYLSPYRRINFDFGLSLFVKLPTCIPFPSFLYS